MLDFLSYLWWRATRRGPGLDPDAPIPYTLADSSLVTIPIATRASSGGLVYLIPDWTA